MTDDEFAKLCRDKCSNYLTCWADYVKCWREYDEYRKKDFELTAYHKWGSVYCDWTGARGELFRILKECGATNISGKVTWNRVDLIFNMKKRLRDKDQKDD